MNEWTIVRTMAVRIGAVGDERLRRALDDWAKTHAQWLYVGETPDWDAARAALACPRGDAAEPHVLAVADVLAQALALETFDAALLRLMVAIDRLPRVSALADAWSRHDRDLPDLLGAVAGAPADDAGPAVRRSAALRLGLASFRANRLGVVEVDLSGPLDRLIDRAAAGPYLCHRRGGRSAPGRPSGPGGFRPRGRRPLSRAAPRRRQSGTGGRNQRPRPRAAGHGPPGTGKTEFARTLGAAAGLSLYAVGEVDEDGDEPSRWDRVSALQLAQRMMAPAGESVLLFDEMEDLIGDAKPSGGDWFSGRQGSKVFVNRLLESNAVPVIWTANALGNVDDAILRRMSFVLKLNLPSPSAARRMMERVAIEEGVVPSAPLEALLGREPETATVLRVAARAARLAGEIDDAARPATALVRALRGCKLPPPVADEVDVDLFETDQPLPPLLARLADSPEITGAPADVSLLLTGPPGTGKTALAHHLAHAVDRPLTVKRASDLLSRWVGGTERAIANAFGDVRELGHVLFFDEADSLLVDRGSATHSWEAGQVNEMLTWLDRHPLPVIAATNHTHRLDAAALRRFVFKIDLAPLGRTRAALAFERFFGLPPPASLVNLMNLTPGDFAAVRRQLRNAPALSAGDLVERLSREAAWRPGRGKLGS